MTIVPRDFAVRRSMRSIAESGSFTDLEFAWLAIECECDLRGQAIEPELRQAYDVQKDMLIDVERIALAD